MNSMIKYMMRHTVSNMTVVMILVLLVSPSALFAAVEFPDTRPGEIAQAYFASFSTGDAEKIREFEATYRSASALEKRSLDDRVPRVMGFFGQLGALDPLEITAETELTISVTAHASKVDMYVSIKFELEADAPNKLESLSIMPTGPPSGMQADISEWKDLADLLEQVRADVDVPALAAAIVQDDKIVEFAAVGVRMVGNDTAVQVGDQFHVGSVTKSMTATAIANVVASGKLDWNSTIGDVLDDLNMNDAYRNVTLLQLLNHRGGIQSYTSITDEDHARLGQISGTTTEIRAKFLVEVLKRDPVGAVGDYMYSNAGYTVATAMAERASGKSWEALIEAHVFTPAAMSNSGFGWPATSEHPDQPRGHWEGGEALTPRGFGTYVLGEYLAPAGNIKTPVEDLARYARMHLRGLEKNDELYERLHTSLTTKTDDMRYAAGWVLQESESMGETHWHNGSAGTFFSLVELYPAKNRAIVVLTNVGISKGTAATQRVVELLNREFKEVQEASNQAE